MWFMSWLTVASLVLSETYKNVVYPPQSGSWDNVINSFKTEKVFPTPLQENKLIELYLKWTSGWTSDCNCCDLSIFASVQEIILLT
jgi:hypothetical protein